MKSTAQPSACRTLLALGAALGLSASSLAAGAEDETLVLSPFTVSSDSDNGYYSPQAVSATRTRTELINLPVNLTVLNEAFLQDIAARDLLDAVVYTAGVSQGTGGGSDTANGDTLGFTLRGQAGFVPYRNGFRRLRVVDPATISRVEVIKGPSSVLYGLAFPGGMVNYVTKRPVKKRITDVNVRVGSYDFYKGTVDVNVPVANKSLAVRFVGSYEDAKSWAARQHGITTVLYPSITWWIRPETTLTFEYESTERHINSPKTALPFHPWLDFFDQHYPIDHSWNARGPSDFIDTDMSAMTAELTHRFNRNLLLRANWTYSIWQDNVRSNGSTPTIPSVAGGAPVNPPTLPARAFGRGIRGSWDDYKQIELVHNFAVHGIDVQTLAGFQRGDEEFRNVYTSINPPALNTIWNLYDPSTWIPTEQYTPAGTSSSSGDYARNLLDSYYITNQLGFWNGKVHTLVGYRSDKIKGSSRSNTNTANPVYGTSSAPRSNTPQFGLLFKPVEGLAFFAQYSESLVNLYTSQQRRADGSFFVPVPGFGKGYDVGVKAEMLQGRVAGTISVFQDDNANIVRTLPQIKLPDGSLVTPAEQSGTDRSTGVEADLRLRPFKNTQLLLSYANTDAYVLSDVQAAVTINGNRLLTRQGHRLQNAPEHNFSFWLRQDLGAIGPFKNTFIAGGGRYISERMWSETYNNINGVLTPPIPLDAYTTFDLSVGGNFTIGKTRYRAAMSAKNITDETYLVQRFAFGAPRTFEFSLTASF